MALYFFNIPLNPTASQELTIQLNNQRCLIKVYEKKRYPVGEPQSAAIYLDLYVNDVLIVGGAILQDSKSVVGPGYIDFVGDLFVYDSEGNLPPQTQGLGGRWKLAYVFDE